MTSPPTSGQQREDFQALFRAAYRPVLAYALRRTEAHRAHDVASETFVIAWAKRDSCPPADQATAWLLGIARNVLRNSQRADQRQVRVASRVAALPEEHAAASDSVPVHEVLDAALAQLTEGQAEILRLAYWDDLDNAQIAQVLRIPKATVAVRLSRARARLRHVLSHRTAASARHLGTPSPALSPTTTSWSQP